MRRRFGANPASKKAPACALLYLDMQQSKRNSAVGRQMDGARRARQVCHIAKNHSQRHQMWPCKARWFQDDCSDARQCTQNPLWPYFSILSSRVVVAATTPLFLMQSGRPPCSAAPTMRAPRGHALAGSGIVHRSYAGTGETPAALNAALPKSTI